MYIFFFIILYIIKKIINILDGKYVNSLSSYLFLLALFTPGNTFIDIYILLLVFASSIHHSIRHKDPTHISTFIHSLDSASIVGLTSYLSLHYLNFYPFIISFLLCIMILVIETKYKNRYPKKIIVLLSSLLIMFNNYFMIIPLIISYLFFDGKLWEKHNMYRFGWHISTCTSIILYLILYFNNYSLSSSSSRDVLFSSDSSIEHVSSDSSSQ